MLDRERLFGREIHEACGCQQESVSESGLTISTYIVEGQPDGSCDNSTVAGAEAAVLVITPGHRLNEGWTASRVRGGKSRRRLLFPRRRAGAIVTVRRPGCVFIWLGLVHSGRWSRAVTRKPNLHITIARFKRLNLVAMSTHLGCGFAARD